jgi:cytidylate kinase
LAVTHGELHGVVAVDGPSGTGKSTVARRLAATLGARYLDTGAMYRAVTLAVLRAGVRPSDAERVAAVAGSAELSVGTEPGRPTIRLDGEDVASEIRSAKVTAAVSAVSAVPAVRARLVGQQQKIIDVALRAGYGIVVEGRDIGTTVAPSAGLKVYLTASSHVRAERRSRQDTAAGRESTVDAALAAVDRRDRLDSTRAISPLRPAEDAVEVDTTTLGVDDVLRELLALVAQRGMGVVPEQTAAQRSGR